MRELVLDTETTGLDYENGDRIVEIGIVELINHIPSGINFHYYLNPDRDSDVSAQKVHGLTREFLSDKPRFGDIAKELLEFLSSSKIIIHNASFDLGFINSELQRCNLNLLKEDQIIDTVGIAKKRFIGQSVSLDALCRKYKIDITDREKHGALKDAKLLSQVYIELIGGKQTRLKFDDSQNNLDYKQQNINLNLDILYGNKNIIPKKRVNISNHDNELHLKSISKIQDSIWNKIKD